MESGDALTPGARVPALRVRVSRGEPRGPEHAQRGTRAGPIRRGRRGAVTLRGTSMQNWLTGAAIALVSAAGTLAISQTMRGPIDARTPDVRVLRTADG